MGTWGYKFYESDDAADWFHDMHDVCKLREHVINSLKAGHTREGAGGVRAAAAIVTMLAKGYMWPPRELEGDVELAVRALEQVRDSLGPRTDQGIVDELDAEIATLTARLAKMRKRRATRRRREARQYRR